MRASLKNWLTSEAARLRREIKSMERLDPVNMATVIRIYRHDAESMERELAEAEMEGAQQ